MRTSLACAGLLWLLVACEGSPPPRREPIRAKAPLPPPPPGTIAGRVELQQPNHPDQPAQPLPHVFVHVKAGVEGTYPVPPEPVVLDQVTFQFVPHVLGIRVGQTLKITSQDSSQHNVFCQPFSNPGFNESIFAGEILEKKFTAPEIMVFLTCKLHDAMKAYVGVVPHPFFTVTGDDGAFEVKGLPPGRYTLAAWQEERGTRVCDVELNADHGRRIDFVYR